MGDANILATVELLNRELARAESYGSIKAQAMGLMRDYLGADGCTLIFSHSSTSRRPLVYHFSDAPTAGDDVRGFRMRYFLKDPIFAALRHQLVERQYGVTTIDELEEPGTFRASDVYRNLYCRYGMHEMVCGIVEPVSSAAATVAFFRGQGGRSFTTREGTFVAAMMPALGSTLHRMMIQQALVGELGHAPIDSDFTILSDRTEPGIHGRKPCARQLSADLFAQQIAVDREIAGAGAKVALLSKRERQIAHIASKGLTNAQIADLAEISSKTVEIHISAVLRKLELNNRTELSFLVNALNARSHELRAALSS